ncbi:GNAT family N-acetyltransferase [Alteromonas sp. NFXS44]|uniref:GNAT family N-acetyltransferase n=1 Tax=Alteromonas sp. NFXS44 TaxID=2818435 RepID=UPI0032DE5359
MRQESLVTVPRIKAWQVTLRPLEEGDLDKLRQWRNSDYVREKMVSTSLITAEQQAAWFQKISHDPSQMHWIIEYKGRPVGSTNVKVPVIGETVVSARVLEPGLYIGEPDYQGNILAFAPTLAMYDYCFSHFNVTEFSAAVKPDNDAALKYNRQLGYEISGQDDFVRLRLQKEAYERQTVTLKSFLSRPRKS